MALGVVKYNSSQSKVMLVNGLYTSNPLTGNQELGMMNVPDTDTDGKVKIPWASATSVATKDTPELYVIFTVTGTVSSDSLNVDVVSVNNEECNIGDTENHLNINGTVDKANACDGAFKIVVDSEKLPYWVQKVTVDAKGTRVELDACVNSDGTTLYSFPVRFISENEVANADIEIYATVSDDESGVTNVREVNWGAVNVDMSGTVTDYAEANPTIE